MEMEMQLEMQFSPPAVRWATPPQTPSVVRNLGSPCWMLSTPPKQCSRSSDPVSRGAQLRKLWSRDRFLSSTGARKFDLRGCGGPAGQASLRRNVAAPHIPTYVPPHMKRRDDVRLHLREQMLECSLPLRTYD
jgi:hypothetical protein